MSTITGKSTLCVLGLLAAGALSAPAFAESTEFRRGYQQGYLDASEAREHQFQPRGSAAKITIDQARYGTRSASCDSRKKLQKAVDKAQNSKDWSKDWRRGFSVVANNQLCGDPAPNSVKQLDINYRCDNGPTQRTQTREGNSVTLHCDGTEAQRRQDRQQLDRQQLAILDARYGSSPGGIVGRLTDKSCNPREKIQNAVNNTRSDRDGRRRDVVIKANNELCGDPAPNSEKRLDLSYRCGSGSVQHTQTREGDSVKLNCP